MYQSELRARAARGRGTTVVCRLVLRRQPLSPARSRPQVCVYACVCVCVCLCVRVRVRVRARASARVRVCVCVCARMRVCACVRGPASIQQFLYKKVSSG